MNFLSNFFLFWSVFSSTDKNYVKGNITTNKIETCVSVLDHCSTVVLSEEDYLFVSKEKLFIRPLSRTIDGSFFTSNGTVAVCECLFYGQETIESQSESCNLTLDDCPKVRLDPRDILHLSDGAVFVKSLNTRLYDSAYGIVNGSVVVCECVNQYQEADVFLNSTCNLRLGETASMSTNCPTLTLRPRDYHFQSNATLRIFEWKVTLNDSFYSVTNDSVIVCAPDCGTGCWVRSKYLQIFYAFLMLFIFEIFELCGFCRYPLLAKIKFASFLHTASSLMNLMHIIHRKVGYYDFSFLLYYELSFLAVVQFGILTIMSSDLTLKFLELIGAAQASIQLESVSHIPQSVSEKPQSVSEKPQSVSNIPQSASDKPQSVSNIFQSVFNKLQSVSDKPQSVSDKPQSAKILLKKPSRIAIFNSCWLIMAFVVAYSFRSQEFSLHSCTSKVSTNGYYYYKQFKELVPLSYIRGVVYVFLAANASISFAHLIWIWRYNPVSLKAAYMISLQLFLFVTSFWIVGQFILIEEELFKKLWPWYGFANFLLSAGIFLFVDRL